MVRDHNLVGVGARIARDGDIYCCDTMESNRVDHLAIRKSTIAIKIRHRKGRLIQHHRISVDPLLLRGTKDHCTRVHYEVARHVAQVVVTRAEPVGSRLRRDLNFVRVSSDIDSGDTV